MIVLDASAAVDIVNNTERGKALAYLVEDYLGEEILTCDLFQAEVRNALLKYVRADLLDIETAGQCVRDAIDMVDGFVPVEELGDEAFREAVRLRHPVYDMLYLCLARRNGAVLFTLDKRLAAICREAGVNCVSETSFAPSAEKNGEGE